MDLFGSPATADEAWSVEKAQIVLQHVARSRVFPAPWSAKLIAAFDQLLRTILPLSNGEATKERDIQRHKVSILPLTARICFVSFDELMSHQHAEIMQHS